VVRNGPVLARTTNVRPEERLKGDHRYLVCWVGKMGRQDRVDLVVEVVDHFVHQLGRTDCGFALLGDGECLAELKQLTGELRLVRWVTFTGWLPEAEVFRYLATSDLGLDTSLQEEVSPVKAMEYMAFGLPIVCFDLPETRLTTGESAILVRPGDVAGAARAIAELLDNVAAREKMAALGRGRVRDELAWELQCPVYLDAIAGRPGSAASRATMDQ
jgi:glycosyltransferase involved in cell wall biosynthesis